MITQIILFIMILTNSISEEYLDREIPLICQEYESIYQRIEYYSKLFLGTEYVLGPLGEGKDAFPDTDPLYDFDKVDCVTFCEQVIALSIAKEGFDDFLDILQHIRYSQGKVDYISRNHYTYTDWIPNNSWLCNNITPSFPQTEVMIEEIDRENFLRNNNVILDYSIPIDIVQCSYVPVNEIEAIEDLLQTGDIIMIVTEKANIVIAHWGLYIHSANSFRHASMSLRKVADFPWDDFKKYLRRKSDFIGILVVRISEEPDLFWR